MLQTHPIPTACPARSMSPQRRKRIAFEALSKSKTQTNISKENGVSRQFVRQQRDVALAAVNDCFTQTDNATLFTINVTKAWLDQCVVSLGLIARASYRETIYFIKQSYGVSSEILWGICQCLRCSIDGDRYAVQSLPLQDQLGDRFDEIEDATIEAMSTTERTSSMCENANGRVRKHITYRQEIGHGYLDLLRFFLNHKPIDRSSREHRHKKTPAEILTGKPHSHWLEMLGYERFKRSA